MKYKIKKRNKKSLLSLFFILLCSFLFMGTGYSYLSDRLSVTGTANIKQQQAEIEGASIFEFDIANIWVNGNEEHLINYTVDLNIVNNDEDATELSLEFYVLNTIPIDINCWASSETVIEGHTVKMKSHSWNGNVPMGNTLSIGFNFTVETIEVIEIGNLKFNGRTIDGIVIYPENVNPDGTIQSN